MDNVIALTPRQETDEILTRLFARLDALMREAGLVEDQIMRELHDSARPNTVPSRRLFESHDA
jgi:hypothetical protein